jgi:SulP family sulfate permease
MTLVVLLLQPESVAIVSDTSEIPRSLPRPNLPDLSLIPSMILPALTIAIIALVQAAGVSGSIPNPDGEYPDPSGDFRGQGAGNFVMGFFAGIPAGGSLSGTSLLQSIGGRSRWANIFTGVFAAIAVLLIAPFIEAIPMPTLAGLLIVVGFGMIKVDRIKTVWHTGPAPTIIMIITFILTLFLPLQIAVALGVVFSIVIYVYRSSEAVRIEQIVMQENGSFIEAEAPEQLTSGKIVILMPIGSLFFAGSAEFEEHLPDIGDAQRAVVIFRLRDRDEVGSTFVRVIKRYGTQVEESGNKLILAGLNERVMEQLQATDLADLLGEEDLFPVEPRFGAALEKAVATAQEWIDAGKSAGSDDSGDDDQHEDETSGQ